MAGPRIVAELGRPETASETAARKAENSRLYRQRKTVNNLTLSLLVSLGMVLLIVLIVPRGTDVWGDHIVDVAAAATAAAPPAAGQAYPGGKKSGDSFDLETPQGAVPVRIP